MADMNARDTKLVQYLNEAYGKERQLETALEAHIAMTTREPYKKRLKQHLQETKSHARDVERRIKQLGGTAETVSVPGPGVVAEAAEVVQDVAQRGVALAQGPLHAVRGTGEQEKQLKNAKTEYSDEAEEIANYTAIETLADAVGDKQTAKIARGIRRQEERMADFLARLIPSLTKSVVQAEIPAPLRNGSRPRRRSSGTRTSARRSTTARSRASGSRSRASGSRSGSSSRTTSRSGARTTSRSGSRSSGRAASRTGGRGSSRSRSTGRASSGARSGTSSRASGSRRSTARGSSGRGRSGSRASASRS